MNNPYDQFSQDNLPLRDFLAADRTILANERTLLAYIRTALTFFVAGVSFIQFFPTVTMEVIGVIFIPTGIVILLIGIKRYYRTHRSLRSLKTPNPPSIDLDESPPPSPLP